MEAQIEEKILPDAVLVLLRQDNGIWLARKTRYIGKGLYNGYGGGIEENETPRQAAVREPHEETTASEHLPGIVIHPNSLHLVGIIYFHNLTENGERRACKVRVYETSVWEGEIWASEEMVDPKLFPENNLPFSEMMLADSHWLPEIVAGKKIEATVYYGPQRKTLIGKVEIKYVDSFPED